MRMSVGWMDHSVPFLSRQVRPVSWSASRATSRASSGEAFVLPWCGTRPSAGPSSSPGSPGSSAHRPRVACRRRTPPRCTAQVRVHPPGLVEQRPGGSASRAGRPAAPVGHFHQCNCFRRLRAGSAETSSAFAPAFPRKRRPERRPDPGGLGILCGAWLSAKVVRGSSWPSRSASSARRSSSQSRSASVARQSSSLYPATTRCCSPSPAAVRLPAPPPARSGCASLPPGPPAGRTRTAARRLME